MGFFMNFGASLNCIYRLIYSRVLNAWVAVSEITRGQGKAGSARRLMVLVMGLGLVRLAEGMPSGGTVTMGSGVIIRSGLTMDIQQNSQDLGLSWKGFNIGLNETVDFMQPNAGAVAVNRIYGTLGSTIMGHLNANGQVYLIDPNGIVFGKGAEVNVGGLVASTLGVTGSDGNGVSFGGGGTGKVTNVGMITARRGGYVVMLGHRVLNEGVVTAQLGSVVLAGGSAMTLTFKGSQVGVVVTEGQLNDMASNGGILSADGGTVVLTAGAKDALLASTVNNSGVIEADTIGDAAGHIQLLSGMEGGTTSNSGTLSAAAPVSGHGGFIETSGHTVNIGGTSDITTKAASGLNGSWLIDPNDFTIAASGGDITGAALSTALGLNSVTIQTSSTTASCAGATCTMGTAGSGNINVNDTVSWSSNTLTLMAANNINVNAVMTMSGVGSIALNPSIMNGGVAAVAGGTINMGMSTAGTVNASTGNPFTGQINASGTGTVSINGTAYTVINSLGTQGSTTGTDLQGMNGNLTGHYVLGSNINAMATNLWGGGVGFSPIGTPNAPFSGVLDGWGHVVNHLNINSHQNFVGLVGYGKNVVIRNIAVGSVRMAGYQDTGSLAGQLTAGSSITHGFSSGIVTGGSQNTGGLVAINGGMIANSYSTASVLNTNSSSGIGGLVAVNSGTLQQDYATGNIIAVQGARSVGGLVGINSGLVSGDYATNRVQGNDSVGGLVGQNLSAGNIARSYATGRVIGSNYVGGLVGASSGYITDSYETGSVIQVGNGWMGGGLIGRTFGGTVKDSYAVGSVSASTYGGGFVGFTGGTTYQQDFYDTTKGQTVSARNMNEVAGQIYGMTSLQMQDQANFSSATTANGNSNPGWDFTTPVWGMVPGKNNGMPILCVFQGCGVVTLPSMPQKIFVDPTGTGSIYGTAPVVGYTLVNGSGRVVTLTNATVGGTATFAGEPTWTSNVGSYGIDYSGGLTLSGSGASNYVLQPYTMPLSWTVSPLALTGTIAVGSSVYGLSLNPGVVSFTNAVTGNVPTGRVGVNITGNTSSSGHLNVGSYTGIEYVSGLSGVTDTADYTYASITGNYTVSQLALSAAISSGGSVYGSTVTPGGGSLTGVLANDGVNKLVGGGNVSNVTTLILNAFYSRIASDVIGETSSQQVFMQGNRQPGTGSSDVMETGHVVMNLLTMDPFLPVPYQIINGGVNMGQYMGFVATSVQNARDSGI